VLATADVRPFVFRDRRERQFVEPLENFVGEPDAASRAETTANRKFLRADKVS
jgi:hypothetical protein